MKNLITCCLVALTSFGSLSAYYYQGGYYNQSLSDSYRYPAINVESNDSNVSYEDLWYQGSLILLASSWLYGSGTYTTYPTLSNSDNAVAEKVRYKLASTSSLTGGSKIDVSVTNGRVTLTGTVASNTEKTMAGSAARSVPGVTGVINHLVIQK